MAWFYLFIAGVFEVVWVIAMKYTEGLTKLIPSAVMIVAMIISFGCLTLAVKYLPLGTSYAIWTGIGAVGAMIAGIILFGESASMFRIASAAMIVAGIIGLKLSAA